MELLLDLFIGGIALSLVVYIVILLRGCTRTFEGRVLYMCKNGHVMYRDIYKDCGEDEPHEVICPYCGTKYERVGDINDTNGDSVAQFYIKIKKLGYTKRRIKNCVLYTEYKPHTYTLVRTNSWVNFNAKSD